MYHYDKGIWFAAKGRHCIEHIKSLNEELKTDFNINWTEKEQKELAAIDSQYEKSKAEFNTFSIEYNKVNIWFYNFFSWKRG